MKGKIITIEGTDCSGKETQSKMLYERLKNDGIDVYRDSFPMYDTPTGKIVGGPYLGKEHIGKPLFEEGASNVDYKVASLYYAADRRYNYINKLKDIIDSGKTLILDRYVESNMAHQGGKILDNQNRYKAYEFLHTLEYVLLELPKPDMTIFLYMPYEYSIKLRNNRIEKPDQHEIDTNHLKHAEQAYLELENIYYFERVNCVSDGKIKTPEEISKEVYNKVKKLIK